MDDKQASRWLLTFDNIDKHGITRCLIKDALNLFSIKYYCMQDEVTDKGMKHTHLYFKTTTNTRFSTNKKRFPNITHIDKALGTAKENKDYIQKQGKYRDSEKSLTSLLETFEEYGSIDETIEDNKINKNELQKNDSKKKSDVIKKEIDKLKIDKSKLLELKLNNRIDDELFDDKLNQLNNDIKLKETEFDKYSVLAKNDADVMKTLEEFRKSIKTSEPLQSFDRAVWDSVIDEYIIGGLDADGNDDLYKIIFI